jgi:hypothetical protein
MTQGRDQGGDSAVSGTTASKPAAANRSARGTSASAPVWPLVQWQVMAPHGCSTAPAVDNDHLNRTDAFSKAASTTGLIDTY